MFILSTPENILLFVSGFGVFQGVISAILLYFHPKADRSVNRFLSLYILSLTLPVILPLVLNLFSWQVIIFIEPFITFMPVFLYLYVRSFKEVITWQKAWPHFIFFVVSVGFAFWVYAVIGSKYPPSHSYPDAARKHVLLLIPFATRILHRVIYYFLSRRALRFYQRSILHLFSDTTQINLNWIRWLINGFLVIILSAVTVYFIMSRYPQYFDWCVLGSGVFIALNVLMATFKGTTQITLWQVHPHITKERLETDLTTAGQIHFQNPGNGNSFQPPKNRLTNTRINDITEKIFAIMKNEKVYQEPELTLRALSDKIKIPPYQVSLAINEGMQKTFYELVNGHRVEEAKRLLLDTKNKNFTILSVGFEAGFNSKTTFNTVFKKFTGFTPTEYREKQKHIVD